jgi:hypothetical protein
MMSLIVEKDSLRGAIDDIRERNLYPTTYVTDHATAAKLHWHNEEVLAYMATQRTFFIDAEGQRVSAGGAHLAMRTYRKSTKVP